MLWHRKPLIDILGENAEVTQMGEIVESIKSLHEI